jgi:hypothetical protein
MLWEFENRTIKESKKLLKDRRIRFNWRKEISWFYGKIMVFNK